MIRRVHVLVCAVFLSVNLLAQENADLPTLKFDSLQVTLESAIKSIENQSDFFCSYNPLTVDLSDQLLLTRTQIPLARLIETIEEQLEIEVQINQSSNKLQFFSKQKRIISGIISDEASGESLQAVAVYHTSSSGTYSNEEGYYSLRITEEVDSLFVSYLGYKTKAIAVQNLLGSSLNISITSDNELTTVIISDTIRSLNDLSNPTPVDYRPESPITGIGGRSDLLSSVRFIPGVSVGSEAQNGFTVRGGGPDQNIILIDGLPIYEASHLGGLSSIFSSETIKHADLYKGDIPARFGGKLSSALDIRLKDGNRNTVNRSASLNFENLKGFIEGPISPKTSIMLNGRISIVGLYANALLPKSSGFVDTEFSYNDFYSKLSHWFSPSNRISFTVYSGRDDIRLEREKIDQAELSFIDLNEVKWKNRLFAINYNVALSDKVFLHSKIGVSTFDFDSRSANSVTSIQDQSNSKLDVNAISQQSDRIAQVALDYFGSRIGKFNFGAGIINHSSAPSILEANTCLDPFERVADSTYLSNEAFCYIENTLDLTSNWTLKSGLRYNYFFGLEDVSYNYFQPRVNLKYSRSRNQINFSYSSMSQFLHLLVNPSSGLPSDLWVPSTSRVAPESSQLFSSTYKYISSKTWSLQIGAFYNLYDNLIAYRNPYEIIQAIVTDHPVFNRDTDEKNWEDRVEIGRGRAYGLEFQFNYERGRFTYLLGYTLSRSERTFKFYANEPEITYPYKYDRPHNISSYLEYRFDENHKLFASWVFGNGNLWTLAESAIPDIEGNPILDERGRNNIRLSNYHKLNLGYSVRREQANGNYFEYTLGIHNAYNNRNPFFSYIEEQPAGSNPPIAVKEVSLYPIFPQINVKYSW